MSCSRTTSPRRRVRPLTANLGGITSRFGWIIVWLEDVTSQAVSSSASDHGTADPVTTADLPNGSTDGYGLAFRGSDTNTSSITWSSGITTEDQRNTGRYSLWCGSFTDPGSGAFDVEGDHGNAASSYESQHVLYFAETPAVQVSYVSSESNANFSGNRDTVTTTTPSGTSGDVLVAFGANYLDVGDPKRDGSAAHLADFTTLGEDGIVDGGDEGQIEVYTRTTDGTEDGSYQLEIPVAETDGYVLFQSIVRVQESQLQTSSGGIYTYTSGSTHAVPAFDVDTDGSIAVLAVVGYYNSVAAPAGWTARESEDSDYWRVFTREVDAGSFSQVNGNSDSGATVSVVVVLEPAGGGGPVSGDGSSALALTTSASGDRIAQGDGSSSLTLTTSASGSVKVSGAGSSQLGLTTSASGSAVVSGAGSASFSLATSASGDRTVQGSGSSALSLSTSATGSRTGQGSGSSSLALSASASGDRTVQGAGSASLGLSTSASGKSTVQGAGSASLAITTSASGGSTIQGDGSASLALSTSASGDHTGQGSGSAFLSLSTSATGRDIGSGSASFSLSTSASGDRTAQGAGSASLALSASASGDHTVKGAGSASLALSTSASGVVGGESGGDLSFSLSTSASGQRTAQGSGSATLSLSVTATGRATIRGSGTTIMAISVVATGGGTVQGVGSSALSLSTTASGDRLVGGSGSAAFSISTSALGDRTATGDGSSVIAVTLSASGSHTGQGVGLASLALTTSAVPSGLADPIARIDIAHRAELAEWLASRAELAEQLGHRAQLGFYKEALVRIESATSERVPVVVWTTADPTATPPSFSVTSAVRSNPGTFVNGNWDSEGWDSTTGRVVAWSALLGDGEALDISEGTTYDLWVRWTASGETPVKLAGTLEAV